MVTFPLDDAYITLHNARVLLTGVDAAYGVSALAGATSVAHLLLVAAFGLVVPLPTANMLVGAAAACLYALGLWRLAMSIQTSRWVAIGTLAIGLCYADTPFQLANGLETGLAMAAVTWAFVLAIEKSPRALPILCGLMPFIRPELAVLSILLIATRAWINPEAFARDVALAAASALPVAAWLVATQGSPIPATAGAKAAFFAESALPVRERLSILFESPAASIVAIMILVSGFLPSRAPFGMAARLFIACLVIAMIGAMPSAALHNYSRYMYPMLPALILLVVGANGHRLVAKAALPALAVFTIALSPASLNHLASGAAFTRNENAAAARWANENLPADARILVHDAGYIAWATRFRLVDLVGLKTPASIDEHRRWTLPSAGRERYRAIGAIAERNAVTHLIALNEGLWSTLPADLQRAGWDIRPLRTPEAYGYVIYEVKQRRQGSQATLTHASPPPGAAPGTGETGARQRGGS